MSADLEELHGLDLEALGRINEHDRSIDRGQDSVCVFGEVGVPGSVDQVDHRVTVGELQCG